MSLKYGDLKMQTDKKVNEENNANDLNIDFSNGVSNFLVKTFIVSFAIVASVSFIVPEIPKIPETEQNKLLLLSFIQNPFVLWRLSELEEAKGKNENASRYVEAAIGLMEMHGASEKSLEKYRDRLKKLKNK
jgi:hypothetical protein